MKRSLLPNQPFKRAGLHLSKAAGDSVSFRLIDGFKGSLAGHELIIIAAGDPILSEVSETRTILGLKKLKVP